MCEYESTCQSSNSCFRCFDFSLLKLPKEKTFKTPTQKYSTSVKDKRSDNSWEQLENEMVHKLNKVPQAGSEARRARGSGNQWFEKYDVMDSVLSIECKERTGNLLKTGDKSMSIKKSWLDKAREEASYNDRTMALAFKFKEDDFSYIAMRSDDIIELVNKVKELQRENNSLKEGK